MIAREHFRVILLIAAVGLSWAKASAGSDVPPGGKLAPCAKAFQALPSETENLESQIAERRASLRAQTKLGDNQGPLEWEHPQRDSGSENQYHLHFPASYPIADLPESLRKLMTTPWGKVWKGGKSPDAPEISTLYSKPILELRAVDIDSLPLFHETKLQAIAPLVKDPSGGPILSGTLDAAAIRLTDPKTEPAFFTSLDPVQESMGLNGDVFLKIEPQPAKKAFLLTLNQPVSESETSKFFNLLSEDPKFWENYRAQHANSNVYDYDLFQNATVQVLRDKYKLPTDLMLYTKDFLESRGMGKQPQVYTWVIFHDRNLLKDAKVSRVYWRDYSMPSLDPGPVDAKYHPVSRAFIDFISAHPELKKAYSDWGTNDGVNSVIKKLRIKKADNPRFFDAFLEPFKSYLTSEEGVRAVQEAVSRAQEKNKPIESAILEAAVPFGMKVKAALDTR